MAHEQTPPFEKPTERQVQDQIIASFDKGEIMLPSMTALAKAEAAMQAKAYLVNREDPTAEDPSHADHRRSLYWAMRNEMDLLTTLVLAKIHGPAAKGVIPTLDHDASIGDLITGQRADLQKEIYLAAGMATGPATADIHLRELDKIANRFVKEKYPPFSGNIPDMP